MLFSPSGSQNLRTTAHQPILRSGRKKILITETPENGLLLLESLLLAHHPCTVVTSLGLGNISLSGPSNCSVDPTRFLIVHCPCHPLSPSFPALTNLSFRHPASPGHLPSPALAPFHTHQPSLLQKQTEPSGPISPIPNPG